MSYQPPYGGPSYPPQNQYPPNQYPPPSNQYPPPNQYAQYPPPNQYPPQGQYHPPPPPFPNQYPPQNQYPPPGQYPPQGQYPPPQQQYKQYGQSPAPQGWGASQQYTQPTPPSLGYGPPTQIAWDGAMDADRLRKAMKGFGTDEKALIYVLAQKDPLQISVLRQAYNQRHGRNLANDLASETSGHFEDGLLAIVRGPLQQDVHILRHAMEGLGTKESVLNDVLLARSNADMKAIKQAYHNTYHRSLEADVKGDLSMKTERHFLMVLAANRAEDSAPVIPQQIDQDVQEIYKATEGKIGTDELMVCSILSSRSDAQIRAIAQAYEARFRGNLETVIKREFSGHMETALLYQLRAGVDRVMRDATLLEDAMSGLGTHDHLLINRIVRCHWNMSYMQQVKSAYRHKYGKELGHRVRGEVSGDYERLMVACIGEQ